MGRAAAKDQDRLAHFLFRHRSTSHPKGAAVRARAFPPPSRESRLQLAIDHAVDEVNIFDHAEMRPFAGVDLQPRIGEASPTERVALRHVSIAFARDAADWN